MSMREPVKTFTVGSILTGALVILSSIQPVLSAPKLTDTTACLRIGEALYKEAQGLQQRTRLPIPREFARVAANLDDYCQDKEFDKAGISIEWMETCLKNYTKPYKLGYCIRGKKYFCATDPSSEACRR
jgi:hypothetical protein